jgi:hypothetical protein
VLGLTPADSFILAASINEIIDFRHGVGPGRRLEEAVEMIYDIATPHDLRGVLGRESVTTEEIDAFIADVDADPAVKLRLLEDVEPQGYGPQGDA